jgi:hypothetical protein
MSAIISKSASDVQWFSTARMAVCGKLISNRACLPHRYCIDHAEGVLFGTADSQ